MNRISQNAYLMEHAEETSRLERKTDPSYVEAQARWCGLKPGQRVLDAGCGPGKTTSILHSLVQPGGSVLLLTPVNAMPSLTRVVWHR